MQPAILFRKAIRDEQEGEIAAKYFPITYNRTTCKDQLVIGRYSCLPYYKELEEDLQFNGCRLINTYKEHRWIADFEYYDDLRIYTPESWREKHFYLCDYPGPFIVKGLTNSRKHQFNTHMYAETRQQALRVASELHNDMLIGEQEIVMRKYVPLKTFEVGINGIRFTNEWRFFYLKDMRLSYGYYWSSADDLSLPYMDSEGLALADKVAQIASKHATFFALDIAEKEAGGWTLVEVNDGQCSGLSENCPKTLYYNLSETLKLMMGSPLYNE